MPELKFVRRGYGSGSRALMVVRAGLTYGDVGPSGRRFIGEVSLVGELVLYRTAIAYSKLGGANQILVIGDDDVLDVRAEDRTLSVATRTGGELRFRIRNSSRAARRISARGRAG